MTDINEFSKGESVIFTVAMKNRDGTVITTPASQTCRVKIGLDLTAAALLTFDTTPQVELTNSTDGVWTVILKDADTTSLVEGKSYRYFVWSELTGEDPILQQSGEFKLKRAL